LTRRKPPRSGSGTFAVDTTGGKPLRLLVATCEAQVGNRYIRLSDLECRLLRVLIEERGRVATRTSLMIAGWAAATPQRVALLDESIERLRGRLGAEVTIETVTGIGYRLL
jgi:DNA-binding response OmpR family regulator